MLEDGKPVRLRELSIRVNLALLILFASGLSVVLASIGFALCEHQSLNASAEREVTALADSLGANSAASLAFNDQKTAQEMLRSLATEPHVLAAFLYDSHHRLFADYHRSAITTGQISSAWRADGAVLTARDLTLSRGIFLDGERVGSIAMVYDLSEFRSRLLQYAQILVIVLFLSMLVTLLASMRWARNLANPLVQLVGVSRRIIRDSDFSVRADIHAGAEIGQLISSFNQMLSHIEAREQELRESEERYALAARGANDGLWDWNLVNHSIYFSPRWNDILGYSVSEHWSNPDEWFNRIHPEDRARVRAEIEAHCEGRTSEFSSEYRMRHKSGGYIWTLSRGIAVRDDKGAAIRLAGSQTDITEGKIADPLTQIPNRLYFLDRLEFALEVARQTGETFAVLFVDLDKFKMVNDSLGHAAGDHLLVAVAGRLRSCIRLHRRQGTRTESVAARIGGDEFAVLLSPIGQESDALTVANRILERLIEPIEFEGHLIIISGSIGIALSSTGHSPEELLRNADTAMYYAKTNGKNRVEFFNEGMRERVINRFQIETGLRKAIDSNQLVAYYQPIVSLSTGRVRGFEALVRWNHPERGLIPPAEFIPVAEESDLICAVGDWVLHEACRQMADWQRKHPLFAGLSVSVNVSTRQMKDPRIIRQVEHALGQTGLNPNCLMLEMTESSMVGNTEQTLELLRRLKSLEVNLEIDDFGTGYSSLSYLQRLPFDTLKIDRSFTREIRAGNTSNIVRVILNLAHSLGMDVIAEGVESEDQMQRLRNWGCNFVQGYLFSPPVPAHAAERLVHEPRSQALLPVELEAGFPESVGF